MADLINFIVGGDGGGTQLFSLVETSNMTDMNKLTSRVGFK